MSGIGAVYARNGQSCNQKLLHRMSAALRGRGEVLDQWSDGPIGLAHAELRHTPLAQQRLIRYTWRSLCVRMTADGYLHNRQALVRLLRWHGGSCDDASDAELIAAAYCLWGTTCVQYLQGDFSFLLWDEHRHRLFGARSPTGLRPFVYSVSQDQIVCASEALQLLEVPSLSKALNETWVSYWLRYGSGHWDGTIFREIQELLPGYAMIVESANVRFEPFWKASPRTMLPYRRQEEYTEHFRALLEQAVQECLHPQRALLFDLSGGLDSSSLVSLAGTSRQHQEQSGPWYGFHARTNADSYVHAVAEKYQLPMNFLSYQDHLPFDGAFDPQPWFSRPCIPPLVLGSFYQQQWAIAANLGIHVHIRGDFGDELLGSSLEYITTCWRENRYLRLGYELLQWKRLHQIPLLRLTERWIIQPSRRHHAEQAIPWLRPPVLHHALQRKKQDEVYFRKECPDPFARQLVQWMHFHGDYIAQADAALRAGLETREPYSDLRLLEFLLTTPPQYQASPWQRKFLLREAMSGLLPESVRQRQDKGHAYRLFFQGIAKHHQTLRSLAQHLPDLIAAYIDPAQLVSALDRVALGDTVHVTALSSTLSLLLWAHRFPGANGSLPVVSTVP